MSTRAVYSVVLLIAVAMYGCATPYQPKGLLGGYSDSQIDPNTYRVVFEGNTRTSRETAQNYLLYRSAEITATSGHDYFVIVSRDTEAKHQSYTAPGHYTSTKKGSGTYVPGQTVTNTRYGASNVIKVFKGEKPVNNPNAFDALVVMKYLGPKIKRPTGKGGQAPPAQEHKQEKFEEQGPNPY